MFLVEYVQCPITFYAKRLYKAMHGPGTNDSALIRLIVSRSEIDLGTIKKEFEKLYDKTLVSYVKSDTSGDYRRALVALIHWCFQMFTWTFFLSQPHIIDLRYNLL